MKELTKEQKTKAYDEALKRAKDFMNDEVHYALKRGENIMCWIFPELRESEDEKMMHQLYSWMKEFGGAEEYTEKVYTWLKSLIKKQETSYTKRDVDNAYIEGMAFAKDELEKQGKQKGYTFKSIPRLLDMIEPSDKAKAYCQKLIDALAKEGYNTDAKIVEEALKGWNGEDVPMAIMDEQKPVFEMKTPEESLGIDSDTYNKIVDECIYGEQKSTELAKGEDYGIDGLWHAQRILEKTFGKVDGYQTDDGILDHKAAITAVKKLYGQKPTDNEMKEALRTEYEKGRADAIAEMQNLAWSEEDEEFLRRAINATKDAYPITAKWLKSLKGRVQPKQEWSEEDEERIIKNACEFMRNHIDPQLTIYHEQTWCKRDEFIKKFCKYMKGK